MRLKDDGVFGTAVASAAPYANNLHLTPDRQPQQHLITQFLPAGCSSWRPTNSVKALKVSQSRKSMFKSWHYYRSNDWINGESMSMPSDRGQLKNRTELLPLFRSSTWSPCESWPSTDYAHALTHIRAIEGLEASSWQTKDSVESDSRITDLQPAVNIGLFTGCQRAQGRCTWRHSWSPGNARDNDDESSISNNKPRHSRRHTRSTYLLGF